MKNIFQTLNVLFWRLSSRSYSIVLVFVFIAGFVVKVIPAINQYFWLDESSSLQRILTTSSLKGLFLYDPSVPPLYPLLIKPLASISTQALSLRSPSIVFSLVTLSIGYYLARQFSSLAAFITVFLLAFSNFQIHYAWQAYTYGLLEMVSALSLFLAYRIITSTTPARKALLFLFVLTNLLGWFTNYVFLWYLLGVGLFLLLYTIPPLLRSQRLPKWAASLSYGSLFTFVPLLFYLPILIGLIPQSLELASWIERPHLLHIGNSFLLFLGFYEYAWKTIPMFVGWVASIVIALFSFRYLRSAIKFRRTHFFLLLCCIYYGTLLGAYLFSVISKHSLYTEKTFIPAAFSLSLIMGILLSKLAEAARLRVVPWFLLVIFIVFNLQSSSVNTGDVYKAKSVYRAAAFLKEKASPDSVFIFFPSYMSVNFDYFWYGYDGSQPGRPYTPVLAEHLLEDDRLLRQKYWLIDTGFGGRTEREEINLVSYCPSRTHIYSLAQATLVECN